MQEKREKFTTLQGKYLLREIKDGFETMKINDLELQSAKRTGFEETANFSQRCEVAYAPEDGKFKVGQTVFCHHMIVNDTYQRNWFDEVLYATLEQNIWFAGETPEEMVDDDLVIFEYFSTGEKVENGVINVSQSDESKGTIISGALPSGSVITYRENKEMEFFYNERQYLITDKIFITSIDGVPYGNWYEFDDYTDTYFDCGFLSLQGQTGRCKQLDLELNKNQKIVKLSNKGLPMHGKEAIISDNFKDKYVNSEMGFYQIHHHDFKGNRGIIIAV